MRNPWEALTPWGYNQAVTDHESDLEELANLIATTDQAEAAYKATLATQHDKIRHILATHPHGIQAELVRRFGISRQHLDRIRRGKTSG